MERQLGTILDVLSTEEKQALGVDDQTIINAIAFSPSVKNIIDNESLKEINHENQKTISNKSRLIYRKNSQKNIFIKEKGVNGMVQKLNELSVWRQDLLNKHKDEIENKNAVESVLKELQSNLKHLKTIGNNEISEHMFKKYSHTIAFSGNRKKVHKYIVQIMSSVMKALGPCERMPTLNEIDSPLIKRKGPLKSGRDRQIYYFQPDFYNYSPACLRVVVDKKKYLQIKAKKAFNIAAKEKRIALRLENKRSTISEKSIGDDFKKNDIESAEVETPIKKDLEIIPVKKTPIIVDKPQGLQKLKESTKTFLNKNKIDPIIKLKKYQEPEPDNSLIASVVSRLDMPRLIDKIVECNGSFKLTVDSLEINTNSNYLNIKKDL